MEKRLLDYLAKEEWPDNTTVLCKRLTNPDILRVLSKHPNVSMVVCAGVTSAEKNDVEIMKLPKVFAMENPIGSFVSGNIRATVGIGFSTDVMDLADCVTMLVYQINNDMSWKKFEVK